MCPTQWEKQGVNLNSLRNVLVDVHVVELVKLHGEVFELVDVDLDVVREAGVLEEILVDVDVVKLVVLDAEVEDDALVIDMHVVAGMSVAITCNGIFGHVLVADVE
eukprot:543894-Amphidinium_carterae.1